MKWRNKAKIMKTVSIFPMWSGEIYRFIQKQFGRLSYLPMSSISTQIEMARWILAKGEIIEGKTFFEVGTGHNPVIPIGFFLTGAKKVITVDLYRRLDYEILKKSLEWMIQNRDILTAHYTTVVEKVIFEEKLGLIERLKHKPEKFLAEANIQYLSPFDATKTGLPDLSVDYHISNTVFEHIPGEIIEGILFEAKRLLKTNGTALHFIDLSDHFQYQDKSINKINFLRYSEAEWHRIASNQFAYCNRLRASDYLSLFNRVGLKVCRIEKQDDEESLQSLKDGFLVNERYHKYGVEDLCITRLKIALSKSV